MIESNISKVYDDKKLIVVPTGEVTPYTAICRANMKQFHFVISQMAMKSNIKNIGPLPPLDGLHKMYVLSSTVFHEIFYLSDHSIRSV